MFGKFGDMVGKLQEMKQRADEIKKKLDSVVLKSESAGGDIKIEITGNRQVKSNYIGSALQHGDQHSLQEKLTTAVNKAIKEADEINEAEMKKAASGLIPGL